MLEGNEKANDYLDFVYRGNILLPEGNNTKCPGCSEIQISRTGYMTQKRNVNNCGKCSKCDTHVFDHLN